VIPRLRIEYAAVPQPPATVADWSTGARLFDGLGDFHRKVTTRSNEAQQYFDQGMRYLWAFNHDESTRSFGRAAQLVATGRHHAGFLCILSVVRPATSAVPAMIRTEPASVCHPISSPRKTLPKVIPNNGIRNVTVSAALEPMS
jgi:hypothetical protein